MIQPTQQTFVPFDILPESRDWRVGRTYRTKMVMKQVGMNEHGANFDVVDATSLEPKDSRKRFFLSEGGSYGGNRL